MTSHRIHLAFPPLPQPVRFVGCDELIDPLCSILHGWDIAESVSLLPPVIRITRTQGGYRRVSCWQHAPSLARKKVRKTVVEAICGFHFELIDWYLVEHRGQVPLHGAAARYGDGVVLFPALAKAGKSTLSVHLAMVGHALFSDDVVPIDAGTREAVAMGIQPRLRQIPPDASDAFRAFVEARPGPTRPRRRYVRLREDEIAPVGERAPVRGVVLLHRQDDVEPALQPAEPAEVLEKLILQNFAMNAPAGEVLDALHAIVAQADCYALRYARAPQAVALLDDAFGAEA